MQKVERRELKSVISIFGVVSFLILVVSVGALILHNKIITRRAAVDEALAAVDNLLHEQLETLYETAITHPDSQDFLELCEDYAALQTRELLIALPELQEEAAHFLPPPEDEKKEALTQAVKTLNTAIDIYNAFITKFPAQLMASILTLEQEHQF
ncbi:MAG: hypothetical protein FWC89_05470 [Defluviitaleaceae bacterium]|nr:hypothetical protein [Defluviitaleaceae bacterium]